MSNNENQRSKKLYRSFDLIEDEFIKEAEPHNEKPISTVRRALIKKVALIAACACIVIAIVPIIAVLNKKSPVRSARALSFSIAIMHCFHSTFHIES